MGKAWACQGRIRVRERGGGGEGRKSGGGNPNTNRMFVRGQLYNFELPSLTNTNMVTPTVSADVS